MMCIYNTVVGGIYHYKRFILIPESIKITRAYCILLHMTNHAIPGHASQLLIERIFLNTIP